MTFPVRIRCPGPIASPFNPDIIAKAMRKKKEFQQNQWGSPLEIELQRLLEIGISEDIDTVGDLTSQALIPEEVQGAASIRAREEGIVAGIPAIPTVLKAVDSSIRWDPNISDGTRLRCGDTIGTLRGPARSLLTAERPILNLLGRLSGVATLTRRFVDETDGTKAQIYDTRKTTLGWRRLEKYAVRCGGGHNHRTGLFDAILIKDNHLAFGAESRNGFRPSEAVDLARDYLRRLAASRDVPGAYGANEFARYNLGFPELPIVEIEVDTLDQLREVLPSEPDIVLLDNMRPEQLLLAVMLREELAPEVELEASGGINLSTVRAVAETGVDRISVGALTHGAVSLDLGMDWKEHAAE